MELKPTLPPLPPLPPPLPVRKSDLATAVHERLQLTKRDSALAVDAVLEAMTKALTDGHELRLLNFGLFTLRNQKARPGRNPKTGVSVEIPARTVVLFRPAEALKEAVDAKSTPAKSAPAKSTPAK